MIKGLYSAFNGMNSAFRYQDALANNIANANTAGFKREVAASQAFDDVLISRQSAVAAPFSARIQDVVGQVGTGKFVAEFATDYSMGPLQQTGQELDLALEDGFFTIEGPEGDVFYTRDGRFDRDAAGDLVTSHGYRVLDADGAPINLPGESVRVDEGGVIRDAEGEPIAELGIADFAPGDLERAGEGYFQSDAAGDAVEANVHQGFLEGSNANLGEELTTLMSVHRAYQANQSVMSQLNQSLEQATGQLGRV